ncbi:hypothetical protein QFZ94_004609 [Paraburkholderia sp. JPY465]
MGRLKEVRKEIEQLCKDIERDARRARRHPATGAKVPSAPKVCIQVVSGDLRVRLKLSIQQDYSHKRR